MAVNALHMKLLVPVFQTSREGSPAETPLEGSNAAKSVKISQNLVIRLHPAQYSCATALLVSTYLLSWQASLQKANMQCVFLLCLTLCAGTVKLQLVFFELKTVFLGYAFLKRLNGWFLEFDDLSTLLTD